MPENEPVLGAPAPAPVLPPAFPPGPTSAWGRVAAVADALGTTVARLVGGLVVAVVLAVVVGWTLLSAPGGAGVGADEALPRAPVTTASTAHASSGVFVYVAGAVVSPGVYRVPADARVADVLDAAGGPAPDADLVVLNLAATVMDGERIYVPRQGEQAPPELAASGSGPGQPAAPVNLNTATVDQLEDLPGVGPATAQAIVAWRQQHGRFKRVDDLLNVRGIGPAKLDALRGQVRV